MALSDDLERIASVASAHGQVTAVLAAEPASGRRGYLVALGDDEERLWLVLDDQGQPVGDRELVREVASMVVMCELAGELAGGGDLEELRSRLAQLRVTKQPEGIVTAEEAARELEHAVGAPPRLATPGYLDQVGAATRRLENALGEYGSPFANAVAASTRAVEEFLREVETRYTRPLR